MEGGRTFKKRTCIALTQIGRKDVRRLAEIEFTQILSDLFALNVIA